jgi:amidase
LRVEEYAQCDAVGLSDLMRTGAVAAEEVELVARQALEAADAELNALAMPLFSSALQHAADGPLAGVPFVIKDVPMARGIPFCVGSRSLEGLVAEHDSDVMVRFRAAGLVTLGVTTVPEMAISFSTESVKHGPTRNPWDLERGVGGSSGGAGALVAAGAVPVAHGNDGAGSLRVPASCCGLVGLKPSRGRTPCGPDTGEAGFGTSCEFGLTRTVRDAAVLLDATQGPAVGDKYTAPPPAGPYADEPTRTPEPLRVACTTTPWSGVPVASEVAQAVQQTVRTLETMGHVVSDASPAVDWEAVMASQVRGMIAIAAPYLMAPRPLQASKLEAVSRQILDEARQLSALDVMSALDAHNRVARSVGAFFAEYDLLVTPTLAQLPAPHGTLQYDNPAHSTQSWLESLFAYGPFTVVFNISGQPAISLPLAQSQSGLPIGVQIVAPYGREDLLLQIAGQLEQAMPWNHRTPARYGARYAAAAPGLEP